jgi:hypothetical protein
MNEFHKNPIRLRSKTYLLQYAITNEKKRLKIFLEKVFKINADSDWRYVIKEENYSNTSSKTIVFIDLTSKSDVYSSKLDFPIDNNIVRGDYWTLTDPNLGLFYVCKQSTPLVAEELLSNIPMLELEQYLHCLVHDDSSLSDSGKRLKTLEEKQLNTIQTYVDRFTAEYGVENPDIQLLTQCIRNTSQYAYNYFLPKEVSDSIDECKAKLKDLKKRNKKN